MSKKAKKTKHSRGLRNILIFDLETIGLPITKGYRKYHPYNKLQYYNNSRIVQMAFQVYEEQKDETYHMTKEYDVIIKPDDFIINNEWCHQNNLAMPRVVLRKE